MRRVTESQESEWEDGEDFSRESDWRRNRRQARRVREDERLKFDSEESD